MNYKEYFAIYRQSAALVWNLDSNKRVARVARFSAKWLLNMTALTEWASNLNEVPELSLWFRSNPRLLLKPGRHYLSRNYDLSLRTKIISNHYATLIGLLSLPFFESLALGDTLVLASIAGKKGGRYQITLGKTNKFDREGELVLVLRDIDHNVDVFCFVFTLARYDNRTGIEIGCIQGPKDEDARELIKRTTKELHGIRPRNLLADATYALAKSWGLSSFLGVSNRSRVYNGSKTHADYDAFWLELGGTLDKEGMFRLPAKLIHHPLSEIPSHHRSEYKRRIELRDSVAKQIYITSKSYGASVIWNGVCHLQ